MIRILDLYIGKSIAMATALTLVVLMILSGLFRFLDQLRAIGRGDYDSLHAVLFSLYSMPGDLVLFFPMAALIGGLVGLGLLASNSELVVMQAAGLSRLNIINAVMKTAVVMMLLVMALAEWGAPVTDRTARELRIKAISGGNLFAAQQGIWAKDGDDFVNIKEVKDSGDLAGVAIYEFSDDLRLEAIIYADSAGFQQDVWKLRDVSRLHFHGDRIERHTWEEQRWRSTLTPDKLGVVAIKPEMLSLRGLHDYLDYLRANQQDTSRYELAFWRKVTQPLTIIAMLLMALSFIFGPLRSVTMAARGLMGVVTGFAFYMSNEVFGPIAIVYQMPPLLGAVLPSLLFIVLAIYLMRKKV
ncbi:LPS export ABC transporter permease LptG [Alkalimonas collagenimarina]|uniref:LPS export ABC transporter permease LptG n=1 Tax=Alkalimonas collagenimarina TaxID=400390 RepID=A0ABT9H3L1_9GAMM|nr:LPS export ABC transporter permease LptG [Alkalimonas collagenimarina]MDP4537883.1 LPS export ABC transporter permease LptG [Alkalimonas collagenimarina]